MTERVMIVPTMDCPAHCSYCFRAHGDVLAMQPETLQATIRWLSRTVSDEHVEITFHGGEPLLTGGEFYQIALPLLRDSLAPRAVTFAVQSNLWLLTNELCELFRGYEVALGTSLDGPEEINDAQRGKGYFRRTMAGVERARKYGLHPGCICTFTPKSARQMETVFQFFHKEGLDFCFHAALPSLSNSKSEEWVLPTEEYGDLMVNLLDLYLASDAKVRIGTLDMLSGGVSASKGGTCTFNDCLGHHLAVTPAGEIYPCQRFAGRPEFRLGSVHHTSSRHGFTRTPGWRALEERQKAVDQACVGCIDLQTCRGGCPYHVLAAYGGLSPVRDPHCTAYRRIFAAIVDRAVTEVFSDDNIAAIVDYPQGGLLQRGRLLSIMRGDREGL